MSGQHDILGRFNNFQEEDIILLNDLHQCKCQMKDI